MCHRVPGRSSSLEKVLLFPPYECPQTRPSFLQAQFPTSLDPSVDSRYLSFFPTIVSCSRFFDPHTSAFIHAFFSTLVFGNRRVYTPGNK